MIVFDSNVTYEAPNKVESACHVRIYERVADKISKKLVVITEIGVGMSVTNASETIATYLVKAGLCKEDDIFIEHYPAIDTWRTSPHDVGVETYDLITYVKWFAFTAHNPTWLRMDNEHMAKLVRYYMADDAEQEERFYKELTDGL